MSDTKQTTRCKDCDILLDELPSTPTQERKPCPSCSSLSRKYEVQIEGNLTFHSKLGIKARHGRSSKPFHEAVSGNDLHTKTGKWMHLERTIDRDNDLYKEVVTDPNTGEIIHKCEEPLTKHQGHGSAKKRRKPK